MREWLELLAKRPCQSEVRDRYRLMEEKCPICIVQHILRHYEVIPYELYSLRLRELGSERYPEAF